MVCSFIPKNIYWTKNHVFSLSSLIWWRIQTVYCLAISIVSFGRLRVEWKTFSSAFIVSRVKMPNILSMEHRCIYFWYTFVCPLGESNSFPWANLQSTFSSLSSLKIKFHFSTKQKFRENDFTKKLNCYVLIMIANIMVNSHICRRQHWWQTSTKNPGKIHSRNLV